MTEEQRERVKIMFTERKLNRGREDILDKIASPLKPRENKRERDRQTDRQTDIDKERETERQRHSERHGQRHRNRESSCSCHHLHTKPN